MKHAPRNTAAMKALRGYSWRATWRAARSIPTAHFPLILTGVHPLASFFILWQLKGLGYSDCRVVATANGLVVHANR